MTSGRDRSLWTVFAEHVAASPERIALTLPAGDISFRRLYDLAERAAAFLISLGLGREDVVAIQWPKRLGTYALWLACLRQGAPYVFLDPRNPDVRTASILQRLKPCLLVTAGKAENPFGAHIQQDADEWLEGLLEGTVSEPAKVHGLSPAYIMFTSGSTGEPKGAVIPQQGVLSLIEWVRRDILPVGEARFSNINPLHFDNAVFDLFGGLFNGATLVPVETMDAANPLQWVKRLRAGRAGVIFAVPTLFQTLQSMRLLTPESLPDATVFQFGGEGFPIGPLRAFHQAFAGKARLVNVYGPTETSCICSSLAVDAQSIAAAGNGLISLGRMHPGFDHRVLDEDGHPVPPGQQGELWIGGANVGLGYIGNPEETARRFRQDPCQNAYRSIFYRTGDLVREDKDGLLWFVGRADHQVKIRGHRVELEEIDLALESFPGVKRGVAVVRPAADGQDICAAFVADCAIDLQAMAAHCRERLPVYMHPVVLQQLETFPQNANGKVDRRAVALKFTGTT